MKNQLGVYKMITIIIGVCVLFIGSIYLITQSGDKDYPSIFSVMKNEQINEEISGEAVNNNAKTESINEISDKIINALHERNIGKIANYVHPNKGVIMSPYVFIEDNAPTFSKQDFTNLFKNDEKVYWGIYDGKGTEIHLTASQYFEKFIHSELYINSDKINVNNMKKSNTNNNVLEKFPDAETIEYYHEGTEEFAGIDWESIILVYEKSKNNEFYLVALVGNRWTV